MQTINRLDDKIDQMSREQQRNTEALGQETQMLDAEINKKSPDSNIGLGVAWWSS